MKVFNVNHIFRNVVILKIYSRKKIFTQIMCSLKSFFQHTKYISYSYGDVTSTGKRLQILTHTKHLWPLSSEGSLACHTYYDTGISFIMVISVDP